MLRAWMMRGHALPCTIDQSPFTTACCRTEQLALRLLPLLVLPVPATVVLLHRNEAHAVTFEQVQCAASADPSRGCMQHAACWRPIHHSHVASTRFTSMMMPTALRFVPPCVQLLCCIHWSLDSWLVAVAKASSLCWFRPQMLRNYGRDTCNLRRTQRSWTSCKQLDAVSSKVFSWQIFHGLLLVCIVSNFLFLLAQLLNIYNSVIGVVFPWA